MTATRKLLVCVPEAHFSWSPHAKSMPLGRLANHVAAFPTVAAIIVKRAGDRPTELATIADLLAYFDRGVTAARAELAALTDERLASDFFVTPTIKKPLWAVLQGRGFMSHLIHHRAQLTVYLRLLDVPIPGMYGPSADEK